MPTVEHNGQQQFYQFVKERLLPHVQGIQLKMIHGPIIRFFLNLYEVRKPGIKNTVF